MDITAFISEKRKIILGYRNQIKGEPVRYLLELTNVAATIGYLSCMPQDIETDTEALDYLTANPFDDFMYKYLLRRILLVDLEEIEAFSARFSQTPVAATLNTLLAEAALQRKELREKGLVAPGAALAPSPLVDLRQEGFADMADHRAWSRIFVDNLQNHAPFPALESTPKLPYSIEEIDNAGKEFVPITQFINQVTEPGDYGRSVEEAISRAEEALRVANVELQPQMLHQSSLAPSGLVRKWQMDISVQTGGLEYTLRGEQTSFGRGLDSDTAKVGLVMEICERFSSWASIGQDGAQGYVNPMPLTYARYSELSEPATNPHDLPLEVPNGDIPLHWLPGQRPDGSSILVPAQFVFLFSNLPEANLCSGLGSTGLGAGLDMHRAKVTALLEVIERDAESVMPHHISRCFRIESRQPAIAELLEKYAARGIELFFEDITSELGVPCYRAFVVGPEGQVTKGASAGLNGEKACLSAMMEVPYPYPWGPPSLPAPQDLPVRMVEDLPDYSTGGFADDLFVLESALIASGRTPAYVNLTRQDMEIPVCRAIIPGMELMADFDRNSRLSSRLFANFLRDMSM